MRSDARAPWLSPCKLALLALAAALSSAGHAHADPVPGMSEAWAGLSVEPGRTRKICQLIGDVDREFDHSTVNLTATRYKFWGTDLGASFEHKGRLYFLFGDTHPTARLTRTPDSDLIASTDDFDPLDCLQLSFETEQDGGYRPLVIPGIDTGAFGVPTGGFSANGRMFIFMTTDRTPTNPMGRSVLARSDDDGRTFRYSRDVSVEKFINVAPVVVQNADVPGLPEDSGQGVLLWASGRYRQSAPYLAHIPADRAEASSAMRYYAGNDPVTGVPTWSGTEADSVPLFDEDCLGELSVRWNPHLRRWLMLYNCGTPENKIYVRASDEPWGPWSEPEILFDPKRDGGYCRFMNVADRPGSDSGGASCVSVSDPHSVGQSGDAYGPYLIPGFSTEGEGDASTIYFLMSTWNPYTVVLMEATLRLEHDTGAVPAS